MSLSYRLERIASYTKGFHSLADIACDHGYLGIFCKKEYNIEDIILTDINVEPLNSAKTNVLKAGLENIEFALGDGLIPLNKDYEVVSISGVGGELITEILKARLDYAKRVKRFILTPNTQTSILREFLSNHHFKIEQEELVFDYKYYEIIVCHYDSDAQPLSELDIKYGPILRLECNDEFKKYYSKKLESLEANFNHIKNLDEKNKLQKQIDELKIIIGASL